MTTATKTFQGTINTRFQIAGRFNNNFYASGIDQLGSIVRNICRAFGQGLGRGGCALAFLWPARNGQGTCNVQISDALNMQAGGMQGMAQEHSAELTGPDQANA